MLNNNESREGMVYNGPLFLSFFFALLLAAFVLVIAFFNQRLDLIVFTLVLGSLTVISALFVTKRYFSFALLYPILITPAILLSLGSHLSEHFFAARTPFSSSLPSEEFFSLSPNLLLLILFPTVILFYLFATAQITLQPLVVAEGAGQLMDDSLSSVGFSSMDMVTDSSRMMLSRGASGEEVGAELQGVSSFVRWWQVLFLLTWLIPTYAIFFEGRLGTLFIQSYGEEALTAQIFTSILIFFVWVITAISSLLFPVQSLSYYGLILRRNYGVEPCDGSLRRHKRSRAILFAILGISLFGLLLLYRFYQLIQ